MVTLGGHILPLVATIAIWFLATGMIAWLDNRERATFPRSLAVAGAIGVMGLVAVVVGSRYATTGAVYLSFAGALAVWAWHEMSFLMGAVAGPRREACPPGAKGWDRFAHASSAMIYHEIALAVTAVLLLSLSWGAPNQTGALIFALLLVLRLSTKVNIFLGVPNMSAEILPPHLDYLQSYFGPRRFGWTLAISLAATLALAVWLGMLALASPADGARAVGMTLLFALAALGALEHLFLALPFRDGALWAWALPGRNDHIGL